MTSALAPATAHLAVRPRATTTARTAIRGNQPSTSPLLASSSRVSLAPLRAIAADAKEAGEAEADDDEPGAEVLEVPEWHSRCLVRDGRVFSETFPVRFDEVGPDKTATMRSCAALIQECACNHAQGIWGRAQSMPADMLKDNLVWVCSRLHLQIDSYPKWGDQVQVNTWFEAQGRLAARRDWSLYYEDSRPVDTQLECDIEQPCESVGRATSVWVAFNLQKRRMARIPQNVVDLFQNQQLCDEPVMGADYSVTKIPETGSDAHVAAFQVRRRDVDMNGHVNNVVYTEWLLEGVPESAWAEFELKEIEIEFRAEATFGETVETRCDTEVYTETDDPRATDGKIRMVHQLMKQGEENPKAAEVVRARTYWVPKK